MAVEEAAAMEEAVEEAVVDSAAVVEVEAKALQPNDDVLMSCRRARKDISKSSESSTRLIPGEHGVLSLTLCI